MDPDRAGAELPAVPDQVVVLAERVRRVAPIALVTLERAGERVMHERPAAAVLVQLEEREVEDPVESVLASSTRPSSRPRWSRSAPSTRSTRALGGGEQHGGAGRRGERFELRVGQELRNRRPDVAVRAVDEVREPLRAPLLRERLELREIPRESSCGTTRNARCRAPNTRTPSLGSPPSRPGSRARTRSGLSDPYRSIASAYESRGTVARAAPSEDSNEATTTCSKTSSTSSRSANASSRSSCRNSNCRSARRSSSRQHVAIW